MSDIELAVRLCDAHQAAAYAWDEWPERHGPKDRETGSEPKDLYRYDALPWEKKEGTRGTYAQTSCRACQNRPFWQELLAWLEWNKGKARLGDYFYRIFDDLSCVG